MRIAGDAGACAALGRELARAAHEVGEAAAAPVRSLLGPAAWSGSAAGAFRLVVVRQCGRAAALAEQLAAAARCADAVAGQLEELQARAQALAVAAAADGLVMDGTGHVLPVLVPVGPFLATESVAEQQRAVHRAEVRERLLEQVAELRADEDALHRRAVAAFRAVETLERDQPVTSTAARVELLVPQQGGSDGGVLPREGADGGGGARDADADRGGGSGVGSEARRSPQERAPDEQGSAPKDPWAPEPSDAVGAVLGVFPKLKLWQVGELSGVRQVLGAVRTAPGLALVGGAAGVPGDLDDGYTLGGSVLKQVGLAGASAGAGMAVAATAPVTVPVAVVAGTATATGIAVGYVGSRLWDFAFGPEQGGRSNGRKGTGPPVRSVPGPPLDPDCGRRPVRTEVS